MKTENFAGDEAQYIQRLSDEVADLKGVLQDVSQQVRRIERRIDLALPEGAKSKRQSAAGAGENCSSALSESQARQTVERLKKDLCDGKPIEAVQSELRDMTMKHELIPIAREFGMTNTALPPKTELVMNIITRLRQSVMLSENIRKASRVAEEKQSIGDHRNVR